MKLLTIAAAAKRLNLSTDRLRQLDDELEPERTESGVRLYRADVVDEYRLARAEPDDVSYMSRMADAIAARFGGPPCAARADEHFAHMPVVELCRRMLAARGESVPREARDGEVIHRAMVAGDLPGLLAGTGQRILRASYETPGDGVLKVAREITVDDFRPVNRIEFDVSPLAPVGEAGEIQQGALRDSTESYQPGSFGRVLSLSRQALASDDLRAFGDLARRLGVAAKAAIADQLTATIVANANMSDGQAVFSAAHNNFVTPGTALSTTSLGVAMAKLRSQKGLDGTTVVNARPKWLLVPAALEALARETVAKINVGQGDDFAIEVAVEPRLDASSAISWYLFSDTIECLEYATRGGPAFAVNSDPRSMIAGLEMKVLADFGTGIVDFRGAVRNAGA